ncbi:MAG: DsbA family protein [Chitinophagaceae bacterium]
MKKKIEFIEIIEPKNIITGDKNAPITITEFGDYESEACAKANEVVKQLLETYPGKVNFVFRHFPLLKFHQKAHKAAEAAIGAAQENKFWEMHNELFARRHNLGVISLKIHAREAGVTNKKFLDNLINSTYGIYVQDDLKEGIKRGVTAIPAFFINDKLFEQEPSFKHLNAYIQGLLKNLSNNINTDSKAAA